MHTEDEDIEERCSCLTGFWETGMCHIQWIPAVHQTRSLRDLYATMRSQATPEGWLVFHILLSLPQVYRVGLQLELVPA